MHSVADGYETDFGVPEIQMDVSLNRSVFHVSQFVSEPDINYLNAVTERLCQVLNRLPRNQPDFGLCHADLVMSNLRLAKDGTVTLFDFGNTKKNMARF